MGYRNNSILQVILILLSFFTLLYSQNSGTVNFSVTTNRTYQNYDPKNIVAIWVTDDADNFVQTLKKRADRRQQYLYTWISNSNQNTVNAVTGATLSSHQSHNVIWNCQDINGNTVPDGWYRIRCEYTTRHAQGPLTPNNYLRFYKGENAFDTTFNDFSYNGQLAYSNISLIYTPDVTNLKGNILNSGISEYKLHQNYPNPFNPQTTIIFEIPDHANKTSLVIYNSIGQKVRKLFSKDDAKGVYQVIWNGMDDLGNEAPSGVYFIQLNTGLVQQTRKMFLLR